MSSNLKDVLLQTQLSGILSINLAGPGEYFLMRNLIGNFVKSLLFLPSFITLIILSFSKDPIISGIMAKLFLGITFVEKEVSLTLKFSFAWTQLGSRAIPCHS